MFGSLVGSVGVAEAIGAVVGVIVGVRVSVGVGVMVGVNVGVKVALGGSVDVRLATGCAVGTGDEICSLTRALRVGGIVAAKGVCWAGWQAAMSKASRSSFQ